MAFEQVKCGADAYLRAEGEEGMGRIAKEGDGTECPLSHRVAVVEKVAGGAAVGHGADESVDGDGGVGEERLVECLS